MSNLLRSGSVHAGAGVRRLRSLQICPRLREGAGGDLTEYFLLQTMWALFKRTMAPATVHDRAAFDSGLLQEALAHFPAHIVRPERKARQHISAVLSRNEVGRDYVYNRQLFKRVGHGWYRFNPLLAVRRTDSDAERWVPLLEVLNAPLCAALAWDEHRRGIQDYLESARPPEAPEAVAAAGATIDLEHDSRKIVASFASEAPALADAAAPGEDTGRRLPWGSPAAKAAEIERIRREIEEKRRLKGP